MEERLSDALGSSLISNIDIVFEEKASQRTNMNLSLYFTGSVTEPMGDFSLYFTGNVTGDLCGTERLSYFTGITTNYPQIVPKSAHSEDFSSNMMSESCLGQKFSQKPNMRHSLFYGDRYSGLYGGLCLFQPMSPYFTGLWWNFTQMAPSRNQHMNFTIHNSLSCKDLHAIQQKLSLYFTDTMSRTLSHILRAPCLGPFTIISLIFYRQNFKVSHVFYRQIFKDPQIPHIWKTFSPNMMCLKQKFSQKTNMEPIHSLGSFTMSGTLYFTGSVFTGRGSNY